MSRVAPILCILLGLCASVFCHTVVMVGPCDVNTDTITFDCSRRNLSSIPKHIWANVTKLDLSENHLNLAHPNVFKKLQHLNRLNTLNLSGNYLPLLVKQLCHLPFLEILDLSGCKLAAVHADTLLSFPRLQKLLLGNNHLLQPPVYGVPRENRPIPFVEINSKLTLKTRSKKPERIAHRADTQMSQGNHLGHSLNMIPHIPFHRKLLTDTLVDNTGTNGTNKTIGTDGSTKRSSHDWEYLVGALVTAIAVSILIAVGAKCKLVHRYLNSYRHSRLNETDVTSQCDPASFEVGFSTQATRSRSPAGEIIDDDDDGFIEDNYIQASERERAARETENWEDDGAEEEVDLPIG